VWPPVSGQQSTSSGVCCQHWGAFFFLVTQWKCLMHTLVPGGGARVMRDSRQRQVLARQFTS